MAIKPASVRIFRCWEQVACVIGKHFASSPQELSSVAAIACRMWKRVESANALAILIMCSWVIGLLIVILLYSYIQNSMICQGREEQSPKHDVGPRQVWDVGKRLICLVSVGAYQLPPPLG